MKSRLVKKIGKVTFDFINYDSNYQPYSIPQQEKAISKLKYPLSTRESLKRNMPLTVKLKEYRRIKRLNPMVLANEDLLMEG